MKKIVLSAVVMLISAAGYAQHAVGSFSLKPQVGVSGANLTGLEGDLKVGFVAGAEFEYQATDIFSLSLGALYSMQGAKFGGGKIDFGSLGSMSVKSAKLNLNYINVPILANVYVVPGLAVKLGLQPGFCVDKDDNNAKTVDLSIPVGLSYEISNFVIDGRYNFGVTKVLKSVDAKNSVFQVTLGYKLDL